MSCCTHCQTNTRRMIEKNIQTSPKLQPQQQKEGTARQCTPEKTKKDLVRTGSHVSASSTCSDKTAVGMAATHDPARMLCNDASWIPQIGCVHHFVDQHSSLCGSLHNAQHNDPHIEGD